MGNAKTKGISMSVRGGRKLLLDKILGGEEIKELRVQRIGETFYMDIEITTNCVKSSI